MKCSFKYAENANVTMHTYLIATHCRNRKLFHCEQISHRHIAQHSLQYYFISLHALCCLNKIHQNCIYTVFEGVQPHRCLNLLLLTRPFLGAGGHMQTVLDWHLSDRPISFVALVMVGELHLFFIISIGSCGLMTSSNSQNNSAQHQSEQRFSRSVGSLWVI